MPRLVESVPKYRTHKPSGQAVVTINGLTHYLGPHGTKASRIEYDRLIAEWLSAGRSPSYGTPDRQITIAEVLLAYLRYAKAYYGEGPRGELSNMKHALKPLRELYGQELATSFGPLQLKAIRQRFVDNGLCRSNINGRIQRIVRVFRWAVSEGLLTPDVPQSLAMVPGLRRGHTEAPEGQKVRPADEAIVAATLDQLSPVVRAMVELQQFTGMRPGELVILRPCDVDRSGEVWEYKPKEHKNLNRGQERTVYIGPQAQDVLRPFLLRPADAYCFSPSEAMAWHRAERNAQRRTPASCGNRIGSNRKSKPEMTAGDRYTPQSYNYAIRRACDRAFPVPEEIAQDAAATAEWQTRHRWAPNRLRHSLATKVRRDFDIDAAKTLLGHSQIGTTQIYAEKDHQRAVEVARLIG